MYMHCCSIKHLKRTAGKAENTMELVNELNKMGTVTKQDTYLEAI